MKTIIIGWANERGDAGCKVIAGPEVSSVDQAGIVFDAKIKHRFPDGIKSLVQYQLEPVARAEFIETNVGDAIEAAEKRRAALEAIARKESAELEKKQSVLREAQARVNETARVRNELMGKRAGANAAAANLDKTPEALRGKMHAVAVDRAKTDLYALDAKVAEAVKNYEEAAAALKALTAPAPAESGNTNTILGS